MADGRLPSLLRAAYDAAVIAALRAIRPDGSTPSVSEIRKALGVSRATAFRHLQRLRGAESNVDA